jgi:hypothetical protein
VLFSEDIIQKSGFPATQESCLDNGESVYTHSHSSLPVLTCDNGDRDLPFVAAILHLVLYDGSGGQWLSLTTFIEDHKKVSTSIQYVHFRHVRRIAYAGIRSGISSVSDMCKEWKRERERERKKKKF